MNNKETCKWKNIETSRSVAILERWFNTSCQSKNDAMCRIPAFYYTLAASDKFKFCPYCGKEIEEVKHER